jgi:hypothetical protein
LLGVLERHGAIGHIFVYNQSFESGRLADLSRWYPKFAGRIRKVQARLFDLLPVMRQHVYHHKFCGFKAVLPALIPNMAYDGMDIGEGGEATAAYERMVRGGLSAGERSKLRKALLAYCKQDTLAMVKILERLRREAAQPRG